MKPTIATLTCPKIITQDVLEESYATSIIIECREELAQTIEEQIVRLRFEELIFLPHLNEIEISCNQYQKIFLRLSKEIHALTLSPHCV